MDDAGHEQLGRARAAAEVLVALEHEDLRPGRGQPGRGGQAVGAGADDHGVVGGHVGVLSGSIAPSARRSTSRSGRPSATAAATASSCSTLTRPAADLHAERLAVDHDDLLGAGLGPAVEVVGAQAERARLGQQHAADLVDASRVAQDVHGVGRASLLHHDRRDPRVVGTGVEQPGHGVGEDLAGGVVDVGLELHDRLAGCASRDDASSPTTTWVTFGRSGRSR